MGLKRTMKKIVNDLKSRFRRRLGPGRIPETNNEIQDSSMSNGQTEVFTNSDMVGLQPHSTLQLVEDLGEASASEVVVFKSCGDLQVLNSYPKAIQVKFNVVRDVLLKEYPPFYDFCVISSDEDYEEALKFKEAICRKFKLAGCSLYEDFYRAGADMFDCMECMMDHSSKIFFYVTRNFTSNAFCRRIQNGAVFTSLMSKVRNQTEKCVPVYPDGIQISFPLRGISGLVLSQQGVMSRCIENTYKPALRDQRLYLDRQNFDRRCILFQKICFQIVKEYKTLMAPNSQNLLELTDGSENNAQVCPYSSSIQGSNVPPPINGNLSNGAQENVHIGGNLESGDFSTNSGKQNSNTQHSKIVQEEVLSDMKNSLKSLLESPGNEEMEIDSEEIERLVTEVKKLLKDVPEVNNGRPSAVTDISDCNNVHIGHVINIHVSPSEPIPKGYKNGPDDSDTDDSE